VLPVPESERDITALVIVSSDHDPFAALDEDFLTALGRQMGGALAVSDLNNALRLRSEELERLSARMVQQHEDERRRLSRELHDETAQLLTAIKMELGVLRTGLPPAQGERIDDALTLTDAGIRSIRAVIEDLRPSLLDDLGLVPALRSVAGAFAERSATRVVLDLPNPAHLPPLGPDAELALFRALQEALSNVARHAGATEVQIALRPTRDDVSLVVEDNGRGLAGVSEVPDPYTGLGLVGMRERLTLLGGSLVLTSLPNGGARLVARVPASRSVRA
jgi:signal transduction histidine kinase